MILFNSLSAKFTKWSNTLKQFVAKLPTNCLSVFDHFVGLAFKGLKVLDSTSKRFIHNIDGTKNNLEGTKQQVSGRVLDANSEFSRRSLFLKRL